MRKRILLRLDNWQAVLSDADDTTPTEGAPPPEPVYGDPAPPLKAMYLRVLHFTP